MTGQNSYNVPQVNSGQPVSLTGEPPVMGWCWGAASFGYIWGIANKVWIALLSLISPINIVMFFVLGVKGHEWAFNSGMFKSVEEYNGAMRSWNRAGKVYFIICMILFALMFLAVLIALGFGIFTVFTVPQVVN